MAQPPYGPAQPPQYPPPYQGPPAPPAPAPYPAYGQGGAPGGPAWGAGQIPPVAPKKNRTGLLVVIGIVVVALIGGGVAAALLLGGNKPSSPSSSLPTPSTATPGDDPTPTPSEDPTTQAPPIDHSLIEARGDITPPPGWTLDQSATPSEPTLTYRHTRTGTAVLVRTDTNFRDWELSRYASSVLVKLAADYPGTTTNRVADGTVNGLEMLRYAAEKVVSSDKEYTVNLVFFRADLPEANIYRISLWVKTENVTELASDVEAIINSFHVVI